MASPMNVSVKDSGTPEIGSHVQKEGVQESGAWTEPPLRTPAPSFEDYKGLERHGVLEHMAPLGAMPNQKVRLRVKNHEPPRRFVQSKLGESVGIKEAVKTPDTSVVTRRSESRKAEDRPQKTSQSRERDDDQDYTPKVAPKHASSKASTPRTSQNGTPSSRTVAGQERLRQVVDSAVERSYELGTPILGLAVRKLFEESLQNRTLADLLDAVLSQRPTPRQAADFQAYIKVARKQIKAENGLGRRSSTTGMGSSSKSSSKSPSKTVRPSVASQMGTHKDANATNHNHIQPPHQPQQHDMALAANGVLPPSEGPPAKRLKRSKSTSSTSSLSSLSSIEPSMDLDHADTAETTQRLQAVPEAKASGAIAPKLHNFPTTKAPQASNKRMSTTAVQAQDESVEELAAKRRKLQKSFDDYNVTESSIRTSPTPRPSAATTIATTVAPNSLSLSTLQTRLRNGTNRSVKAEDTEDVRSPASSAQGELLVPPPPGMQDHSRDGTPNHIGRPQKPVRKAARVKMS